MGKKHLWSVLLCLPVSVLAAEGFSPRLEVTPSQVVPGMPFVVTLAGEFTAPECLLEPGQVEGHLDGEARTFEVRFTAAAPEGCFPVAAPAEAVGAALMPGERSFGVFRLPENVLESVPAGESLAVAFVNAAGEPVAQSPLTVFQEASRLQAPRPTSGVYWDPHRPGNGFALEVVNEASLLVTAFSYDDSGQARWWSAQGDLVGGVLETDFVRVAGGFCLLCDDPFVPPDLSLPPAARTPFLPMAWIVRGEGKAFLSFGELPRPVLPLVRFQLQPPPPEFRRPGLAGEWLLVDLERDRTFAAVRFTQREAGEFGQFTAATEDGRIQVRCFRFSECEITLDTASYPLRRGDLTPDRLSGPEFVGVRVR